MFKNKGPSLIDAIYNPILPFSECLYFPTSAHSNI